MAEENYSVDKCPQNKRGLKGDFDNSFSCFLTGRPDADYRGWGYEDCDFKGKDYRNCQRYKSGEEEAVR